MFWFVKSESEGSGQRLCLDSLETLPHHTGYFIDDFNWVHFLSLLLFFANHSLPSLLTLWSIRLSILHTQFLQGFWDSLSNSGKITCYDHYNSYVTKYTKLSFASFHSCLLLVMKLCLFCCKVRRLCCAKLQKICWPASASQNFVSNTFPIDSVKRFIPSEPKWLNLI